ncbi:MAG TPA: DMT family transporter [Nitrososphaeraceae archaeon]
MGVTINGWVAVISTAAFSIEAVMVELLYVIASIPALAVAAGSMPLAGAMVLIINGYVFRKKFTIFKGNGWKILLAGAALFTAADFLWFDSVDKIGAGKTMLLTIPAEDVFIVLLAVVFLAERMLKLQLLGIGIAIVGFTISAASNVSASGVQFQIGDLQAILSAMCNALAIILFAKLIVRYNPTEVSGWIMLISGLVINAIQYTFFPPQLPIIDWLYMIGFSFIALAAFTLYNVSMKRIGTSMTSIITSSSLVLTVIIQLAIVPFGIAFSLPGNLILALLGGGISMAGIYISTKAEQRKEKTVEKIKEKKKEVIITS